MLENLKNKFMKLYTPERVFIVAGGVFFCQASPSTICPTKDSQIWDKT
jgi:hypothetical protein